MNHEEKSSLTKQKETAKTTKIIQKQYKSEKENDDEINTRHC